MSRKDEDGGEDGDEVEGDGDEDEYEDDNDVDEDDHDDPACWMTGEEAIKAEADGHDDAEDGNNGDADDVRFGDRFRLSIIHRASEPGVYR